MSRWRRFVCWLARKEIGEITVQCTKSMAESTQFVERAAAAIEKTGQANAELIAHIEITRRQAYAEGQCVGRQEMYDHISQIVAARTHGHGDYVNPEDLALAKKGLLH